MNVEALSFKQSMVVAGGILIGGGGEKDAHGDPENVSDALSGKKGLQGRRRSGGANTSPRLIFGQTQHLTQSPKNKPLELCLLDHWVATCFRQPCEFYSSRVPAICFNHCHHGRFISRRDDQLMAAEKK
jgi:hypothetical protein